MNTTIIISKCLGQHRGKQDGPWHKFHFKGVCHGKQIKGVYLKSIEKRSILPVKGLEYLIVFKTLGFCGGILSGEIVKIKSLDQYWDRS